MDGSKANFDVWTIDYTTEVHPENAVGSTHYSGQSLLASSWPGEAWNSWAWPSGSEFAGLSLVKIDFLYTGADKLNFNAMRYDNGWRVYKYSDFIYNGTRYTSTEDYVIEGKATWQSIYLVVADRDFSGGGTRLAFSDAAKTNETGYHEMWFGDIRNVSDVAIADLLYDASIIINGTKAGEGARVSAPARPEGRKETGRPGRRKRRGRRA